MNKQMLKWILGQLDEAALLNLADATATKVNGFREITKSNIKLVKPLILNELQKPTKVAKLMNGLRRHIIKTLQEDDIKSLQQRNQEELTELILSNTYTLSDVLIVLMTGDDEEQQQQLELADQVFTFISQKENNPDSPSKESTDSDANVTPEQSLITAEADKKIQKLDEQLTKEKEMNTGLQAAIDEIRAKRKTESQEWRKERKKYTDEIKELKSESEKKSTELGQQEVLINNQRDEIKSLNIRIKELTIKLENSKPILISTIAPPEQLQPSKIAVNKLRVILLGESIPSSIMNTPKFHINLITNSQLEEFLKLEIQADEIWMISFQISSQKQRKVRNAIAHNRFIEFATIPELQTYMSKR